MVTNNLGKDFLKDFNNRNALLFLMLVFAGDLFYFVIHTYHVISDRNLLFHIGTDGGYPEFYQYLKFFWIGILLVYYAFKQKSYGFLSWAFLFIFFLLDDSLQFHEGGGKIFAERFDFNPPFGISLRQFGEFLVTVLAGVIIFIPPVVAYWKGKGNFRKISNDLILLVGLLIFCGVVIDEVNEFLHSSIRAANFIMTMLEDGGEMVSATLIAWYVFLLNVRNPDETKTIVESLKELVFKRKNSKS